MFTSLFAPLIRTLSPHMNLSKKRLETLVVLITGMVNSRTVNLSHIASHFPGAAKASSNYRRLQRFFQHVQLDQAVVARLVVRMLNLRQPVMLALDRTQWELGGKDINMLVLAIVGRRSRVPLMWTLLDHRGNSSTAQRVELIGRYLALFGASSIKLLLADREFVGADWMDYLNKNNVPFAIRIRAEQHFTLTGGMTVSFNTLLKRKQAKRSWSGHLPATGTALNVIAKPLGKGQWLIIATNQDKPRVALNAYRKRWAIECLFGDTKTRGLNMEDTRLTNPEKLSTLLAIITLALTWAYRCATQTMGVKNIRQKSHGRREKSWFRVGLDVLRQWIIHHPDKAVSAWISTCTKPAKWP